MNVTGFFTRFAQPLKAAAVVSTALMMPAILAGCSGSNTAPFQAVPGIPTVTIAAAPATIPNTATLPATSTVTFTLTTPAPAGGLTVTYGIAEATTPAGATAATFTPAVDPAATVTIPAGATTGTVDLSVTAFPSNDATTVVTFSLVASPETYTVGEANTATVTIVAPVTPPPATTVAVDPAAAAKPVASGYRLLVGIDPASDPALGGTLTAGGATFIRSGVQTVAGKTVFVPNAASAFAAIASFTEIDFENLTGGPAGTDFTTVCFEVEDLQATPVAVVSDSAACP
ncbi:MAG: hypothetical protein OHK0012_10770 [Synechococcales cyanobacterium]